MSPWKPFLALAAVAAATSFAAPPPPKKPEPPPAPKPLPRVKNEGALTVLAWPGYLERGETDKAYDWVTAFEKETGCKVTVQTAATSDEMVEKLHAPGVDLVTASGDASVRLIKTGKVQPLDLGRLPSWATVDSRLQNAPWHTADGKHYGVPYQWGPNVLMYDTRVFPKPPTSWSVLFEAQALPDGKPNAGRVDAYDGPIAVADAALYLMKKKPDLGIKDPYELTGAQYAAVLDLLRAQKPLLHRYWHDTTVHTDDFKKEGVVASSAWGYQVNSLKAEKYPVKSTVPQEGCTGWADSTMLLADAPHPSCAYLWMEWSLRPQLQSALAEWFGSLPVVAEACKTPAPGGSDFCQTNGYDRFETIYFWKTPELACTTQKSCVPYRTWLTDYTALKAAKAK